MNTRLQFETIHFLSKIAERTPALELMLAEYKHNLRQSMEEESWQKFTAGRCIKDFGDGSAIMLVPIREAYSNSTLDEVARIFENNYEMHCPNSPYDCTGQPYTAWYKLVNRRGMWYAYHCIGIDC